MDMFTIDEKPTCATTPTRRVPRRILVAEDNALNRLLIQAILEEMGHHADLVNDGLQALEQVQAAVYDLVLMDIQMPRMDGLQATRAIRALGNGHADIPIVALTANDIIGDRDSCLAAGCNGHSTKPIDFDRLGDEIDRVCSPSRRARPTP
jgi:CheY-like chemotaxis protein